MQDVLKFAVVQVQREKVDDHLISEFVARNYRLLTFEVCRITTIYILDVKMI